MSFNKKNETNNMSKSQSLNYNIDNYKLNREQTVKKNKIINIRIYQNYSSNKNSNAFYPYSNDFFDINNLQKRKTNEIGTQTDTEKTSLSEKPKGLKNFALNNYMNSLLQCFYHIKGIRASFLNPKNCSLTFLTSSEGRI